MSSNQQISRRKEGVVSVAEAFKLMMRPVRSDTECETSSQGGPVSFGLMIQHKAYVPKTWCASRPKSKRGTKASNLTCRRSERGDACLTMPRATEFERSGRRTPRSWISLRRLVTESY